MVLSNQAANQISHVDNKELNLVVSVLLTFTDQGKFASKMLIRIWWLHISGQVNSGTRCCICDLNPFVLGHFYAHEFEQPVHYNLNISKSAKHISDLIVCLLLTHMTNDISLSVTKDSGPPRALEHAL